MAGILLFFTASRDDPDLRRSVTGLAIGTAIGCGLLIGAAFTDGALQAALWVLALALDGVGPYSSAPRAGRSSRTTSPSATG